MFKSIIDFYRVSQAKPCNGGALSSNSLSFRLTVPNPVTGISSAWNLHED